MTNLSNGTLEAWGWNRGSMPAGLGRIIREHKGGYAIVDGHLGEHLGVVSGKLRRAIAQGQAPRPVPGDWVLLEPQPGQRAIMSEVLPRQSWLRRRSPEAGEQVLGANIDTLLIVMAVNQDFNLRRLERYLAVAKDGRVQPRVLLTKADLVSDAETKRAEAARLAPTVLSSQVTGQGLEEAYAWLQPQRTHALLGSSGVGKSTFVNRWLAKDTQPTRAIRDDGKGRHTTTERTLFLLPNGALVMDSPGMRELGVIEASDEAFEDIEALAGECRFSDCNHGGEPDCEVQRALAEGRLDRARFSHYEKLRLERTGTSTGRHARQRKR